jgi:prevent-host-death family protein
MDLTEDIQPVNALTRGAADLINRATEHHSPIVITPNGRPTAVLQDVVSYERRVLHLLKLLAQGDHDHDAGRVHDTAAVDAAIRDRLAAHRDQL